MTQIYQLISEKGSPVANHFVIVKGERQILQSYSSLVCEFDGTKITFGQHYQYSRTTKKYVTLFLKNLGLPGIACMEQDKNTVFGKITI